MVNCLSRVLLKAISVFFLLSSCSSVSDSILDDARRTEEELLQILFRAQEIDDLLASKSDLERLFNQLVDTAILAQNWSYQHDGAALPIREEDQEVAVKLDQAMEHALTIDGAAFVLREVQASALERLDSIEQKRAKKAVRRL